MVIALAVIWIAFNIRSGGDFLTARNLWNLSVQSTSIAIMATGMVLIIVSRNIDLSVGSLLGFLGYTMALVQTDGMIPFFGLDLRSSVCGALVHRGSSPSPSASSWARSSAASPGSSSPTSASLVHRHARRLPRLARPDLPQLQAGPDARPAEQHVPAPRRRTEGSARRVAQLAARRAGCAAIAYSIYFARQRRRRYDFTVRPLGVDIGLGRDRWSGCARRRPGRQQLPVAGAARPRPRRGERDRLARRWPEDPDGRRLPGRHHDRRHRPHDVPRPTASLRPLRVRHRRQP